LNSIYEGITLERETIEADVIIIDPKKYKLLENGGSRKQSLAR
jgi:hypothetical protein